MALVMARSHGWGSPSETRAGNHLGHGAPCGDTGGHQAVNNDATAAHERWEHGGSLAFGTDEHNGLTPRVYSDVFFFFKHLVIASVARTLV